MLSQASGGAAVKQSLDVDSALGDCEARSTDSRVWGPLAQSRVVARPVLRVWQSVCVRRLSSVCRHKAHLTWIRDDQGQSSPCAIG